MENTSQDGRFWAKDSLMVAEKRPSGDPLAGMDVPSLLSLRHRIDQILPPMTLQSLDLEGELVRQYRKAQDLQEDVIADDVVPANQKAQVLSACAATLQQLVKMQVELHDAERFKTIEGLMIRYMKKLPLEVATAFLDEYEALK